jgi:hypothetical protein
MDPLSITLGITTLLALAKEVVHFIKEAKDASDERNKFVRETLSLRGMLNTLIEFINEESPDGPWYNAVSDLLVRNGPIDQFSLALQQLKIKLTPASRLRRVGEALMWKQVKEDVRSLLSQLERLKTLVGMALELDHMLVLQIHHPTVHSTDSTSRLSLEIRSDLKGVTTGIVDLKIGNSIVQDNTALILDQLSAQRKKELLNKICHVDYLQQHSDFMKRHHSGTGNWFLLDPIYRDWSTSSCGTLVCPGTPGAGKTIMAALVIENLLRAAPCPQHPVAFIYYSYKSRDQQSLRHAIETVLRQVVTVLPKIPDSVERLFSYTPSTHEVGSALRGLLSDGRQLTIVIDALDECDDHIRVDILTWIADLQSSVAVRFLVTTRDFCANTSHPVFRCQPLLEVKASRHDLELYTRSRATGLRAKASSDLIEDLVNGVVTASDGMYVAIYTRRPRE